MKLVIKAIWLSVCCCDCCSKIDAVQGEKTLTQFKVNWINELAIFEKGGREIMK